MQLKDNEASVAVKNEGRSANAVAKAGLWYTVCNFLFKGMAFITTPIFTRLMTKAELGSFSNYSAWITIFVVITSFDLSQSVIRSKLEHEDDMDSYIWSLMVLSTIWTAVVYAVVCIFQGFFTQLLQIEMKYIHFMFLYLVTAPAYSMLITKHRAFYKYKTFVALTGLMTVSATLLSVGLVYLLEDKLAGRIWGFYVPHIVISGIIYVLLMVRGKKVKLEYWKYACVICLPLVPHVLSLYLLSSSDKNIITYMCGAEYTAIYSVAYSAYHIVTILFDSMNKAWAPWLLESLHLKKYDSIMKTSKIYIGIFVVMIVGVLMVIPEIILILGGKKYLDAVYCLPPLITSCMIQFVYTMYVNIEFYEKKTFGVSVATMIATGANILLNFILIPMNKEYSYVIAAYTTLAGYALLFVIHYFIVKRMKMDFVYDTKFILIVLSSVFVISIVMNFVYKFTLLRYGIVVAYGGAVLYVAYKNKDKILGILSKKKKSSPKTV